MGKLVLTRRAGESVKLTEPNGREWLLILETFPGRSILDMVCGKTTFRISRTGDADSVKIGLQARESMTFAGGNVELRPHKRPDQAILAFDFPRDVTIVRTEIA